MNSSNGNEADYDVVVTASVPAVVEFYLLFFLFNNIQ